MEKKKEEEQEILVEQKILEEKWWNLNFDGAVSKEGVGEGICINGPNNDYKICSYKLYFDCTNNVAEYEALILGLKLLKKLKIKKVCIYGD